MEYDKLSHEQRAFVNAALQGRSILVDACIGSGKTTAIQSLCNLLPLGKSVLYLTYNKLLKLDAKSKIQQYNVDVTNYHSFAYRELVSRGIHTSVQECVSDYPRHDLPTRHYDILILDEYQDIDQEIACLLEHVKKKNPWLQIIAVGDMAQKIYDRTRLDAARFINGFLPAGYDRLEFTYCFRLSYEHAAMLGEVWGKKIYGVNDSCTVTEMDFREAMDFLAQSDPGDILCLGANTGQRSGMLNELEKRYPSKFNKNTVWSKISEGGSTEPTPNAAIFTTYDGCKGMERDVCVLFDWDVSYWNARVQKPEARYEIIRNIFCVAASRGKSSIIFVTPWNHKPPITKEVLMDDSKFPVNFKNMAISSMFDFKYAEDVEAAYRALDVRETAPAGQEIDIPGCDALIDLSPCISLYQQAAYFDSYNIDADIIEYFQTHSDLDYRQLEGFENWTMEQKVLYLTMLETNQNRYWNQVALPFVQQDKYAEIAARLATRLRPDARVQTNCDIPFCDASGMPLFRAKGLADVEENGVVYELQFVADLMHTHFLQCAMCMFARGVDVGVLWNIRTGQSFEVRIPHKQRFMDLVAKAVTKGRLKAYYGPDIVHRVRTSPSPGNAPQGRQKAPVKAPGGLVMQDVLNRVQDVKYQTYVAAKIAATRNNYESKSLSFCMANPVSSAKAIFELLCAGNLKDKQAAELVHGSFKKSGLRPPYRAEVFYKYFRSYMTLMMK